MQLSYVIFLGFIGATMLQESLRAFWRSKQAGAPVRRAHVHSWVHGLPLKMKFRASGLYISVIPPLMVGRWWAFWRPSWGWAAGSSWCPR